MNDDKPRKSPEAHPEVGPADPGSAPEAPGIAEPIEAAYRVTPAEIEQAMSRTSAQYLGDLRTVLAEVGKVYEGQLAAKDQTIAAQEALLAAKEETIGYWRHQAQRAQGQFERQSADLVKSIIRQAQEREAARVAAERPDVSR